MIEYYVNYKKPGLYSFKNIDVEIGFGKGDFLIKKAIEHPKKLFLGFEISIISLKNLYKRIKKQNIKNIRYSKVDAVVGFQVLFSDNSVDNIYINYPDPFPKKRDIKRRITRKYALLTFLKKLKLNGNIYIRTDHEDFYKFTIEQAKEIDSFSVKYSKLTVKNPLTKYEKKWLNEGKNLFFIKLSKVKESYIDLPYEFKEVNLYPLKIKKREIELKNIENKEFKIDSFSTVRFLNYATKNSVFLIETILSENGFLQRFYIRIREKDNHFVIDVSPFSEVLLTQGVKKAVEFLSQKI